MDWRGFDWALLLLWGAFLFLGTAYAAVGAGFRLLGQRAELLLVAAFFAATKLRFGIAMCGFSAWSILSVFVPVYFFVSLVMQANGAAATTTATAVEIYIAECLFFLPAMLVVYAALRVLPRRWVRRCCCCCPPKAPNKIRAE